MSKVRIIKRTSPDGIVQYIIQQKHFLFWWQWVDAWINSWSGADCRDAFDTLKEAQDNLCYFDGTSCVDVVIEH